MRAYLDILKLVWPLALGMVNNALMQFVDRAYLARDSMESLEAVMPAGMLAWIFMGLFQSVVGYSGVFVAQYHGSQNEANCRATYRVALWLSLFAGMFSIPLLPFGKWIFSFTASSESLFARECAYYDIMILGGIFVYGYMAAVSYFTGRGKTRIVFWIGLLGNIINIALDPILIFGWLGFPCLGIKGAALATVLATFIQMFILVGIIGVQFHRSPIKERGDRALMWRLLRFGIPAGVYEVLNMTSFTIFVFVTEGVGHLELAVSNACFTVNYMLFAPTLGFALGAQTLVGQARGRGDDKAASRALSRTLILGLGFVTLCCSTMLVFYRPILSIFSSDPAFHSLGLKLMMVMAAWMLFDASDVIISGALKGAGDTRFVLYWMLFNAFVIWLPVVFIVRHYHNTMPMLWATNILYVVLICIGSYIRWVKGKWQGIKVIEGTSACRAR